MAVSFAASSGILAGEPVVLVHEGRSRATIHVAAAVMADDQTLPAGADALAESQRRRLRESVRDLAVYLERVSGGAVPIHLGLPEDDATTLPILVGSLAEDRFGPASSTTEFRQSYRVVVSPQGLGLQGETEEATSYAIYVCSTNSGADGTCPVRWGRSCPGKRPSR